MSRSNWLCWPWRVSWDSSGVWERAAREGRFFSAPWPPALSGTASYPPGGTAPPTQEGQIRRKSPACRRGRHNGRGRHNNRPPDRRRTRFRRTRFRLGHAAGRGSTRGRAARGHAVGRPSISGSAARGVHHAAPAGVAAIGGLPPATVGGLPPAPVRVGHGAMENTGYYGGNMGYSNWGGWQSSNCGGWQSSNCGNSCGGRVVYSSCGTSTYGRSSYGMSSCGTSSCGTSSCGMSSCGTSSCGTSSCGGRVVYYYGGHGHYGGHGGMRVISGGSCSSCVGGAVPPGGYEAVPDNAGGQGAEKISFRAARSQTPKDTQETRQSQQSQFDRDIIFGSGCGRNSKRNRAVCFRSVPFFYTVELGDPFA